MKLRFFGFLLGFLIWQMSAASAAESPRMALVIGNGAYSVGPLANPINDAEAMSRALEGAGFEVTQATDLSYRALQRAVVQFGRDVRAKGEDTVAMVFYAGHAVQANGENYLIPVDADISDALDLEIQSLRVSTLMQSLESAGNRLNMVVLDACRDNPFPSMSRSGSRGLAKIDAPHGTLLAYSTAPGDVAADGGGRNSPYTAALVKALREPGVPVEQVFKRVRIEVMERTGNRQIPWESSSLTGDFYFTPEATVEAAPAAAPEPAGRETNTDAEIEYWRSIAASDDPAYFESYLTQYPEGLFASIARQRIENLTSARAAQEAERAASRRLEEARAVWESVKDSSDPALLQPLIDGYGDTLYAELARVRMDAIAQARQAPPPPAPPPPPASSPPPKADEPAQVAALSPPAKPVGQPWRIEWSVGKSQGTDAFCRVGETASLDFELVDGEYSGRLTSSKGSNADLKMTVGDNDRLRVDARVSRWVQSRNVFFLDLDEDGDRIEFITPNGFACTLVIELSRR